MRIWTAIVTARVSHQLACLEWERLMLYPAHVPVKDIADRAECDGARGLGYRHRADAGRFPVVPPVTTGIMESPVRAAHTMHYAPTTVEQLEDSPVIAGLYFHEYRARARGHAEALHRRGLRMKPADSKLRPETAGGDLEPGARGGRGVRVAPLQQLPLPADAVGRRGR